MNILILTPDSVGSTLLQRVLTVHMDGKFDKPVINLHELSNGIVKYHSDVFNQDVLGKGNDWGYWQSLPEATKLLKSADHYVTSRLAHYHLVKRNDSMPEQTDFYRYLDENFYIISCRRKSVFEHALSRCIVGVSNKSNVYSHDEKIDTASNLVKNKITVPAETLTSHLDAYKSYIKWADTYFNIRSVFVYEDHMPNIEGFIHGLDCFGTKKLNTWEQISDLSWKDWNRCHRLISDINSLPDVKLLEHIGQDTSMLLTIAKNLPTVEQKFLATTLTPYTKSILKIDKLVKDRVLVTSVPIKMQTLIEKRMMIKNFNECAVTYNEWAEKNDYPVIKDSQEIADQAYDELKNWYEEVPNNLLDIKNPE